MKMIIGGAALLLALVGPGDADNLVRNVISKSIISERAIPNATPKKADSGSQVEIKLSAICCATP